MKMKTIKTEKIICPCCMENHTVKTVIVREHTVFKNRDFDYDAEYLFCDMADELFMDEKQIQQNDICMKDTYRRLTGLLTSTEIKGIRDKYNITQSDLCILLGWGGKTITRYESHQVQDKAHDTILKKIDNDPEWFMTLLNDNKCNLTKEAYQKSMESAQKLCKEDEIYNLRILVKNLQMENKKLNELLKTHA